MTDFNLLKEEDLFEEPFLSEYKEEMQFFYSELVHLNVQLFIIEKIMRFRFDLFVNPNQTIFFSNVLSSFFESSILRIARIITDTDGDFRTITKFKNRIFQSIKDVYKGEFRNRIKENRFDKNTEELLVKIRARRNQRIAHTIINVSEEDLHKSTIYLKDLFSLRDQLNSILSTLSFGTTRMMLPIQYDEHVQHPKGTDSRTDIERILDSLAFDSFILSLPEKNPVLWDARKRSLKEHDIKEINFYRSKLGLKNV
ncbi:hypothetical protein [Paenibacillus sp. YYML68]|uniref:AbiU2 domain-containing protein n=1 Tax=Paenibacillus sp. YYML68 TaxID=2909250 RepID=UPI00249061B2|nr:hypothetical protein [Paenibacillus sp. YYML68]